MAKGNKTKEEKKQARLKPFAVTTVCREDILTAFEDVSDFEYKKVERILDSLTDEDMERLASKMGEAYVENGFWGDIKGIFYDEFVPEAD